MEHFYDGQVKRYLTQFMRLMSNFAYKDAKGKLVQIPVRYGDMNRQVAQILTKNSENIVQSAPFIACYIKGLDFDRDRMQDPTYVDKINIRERAYDADGQEYLNTQGANYTIERLMPTPFKLQFTADIWTTNTDQKLQILEQLLVLFNPSMEIQTNNNFVDWTSLSLIELTNMVYSSRSVPQGLEQDIDIATLNFASPIWLTTPAKVKKLGIITKIVTSMFADPPGTVESGAYANQEIDYFTGRTSISVGVRTLGNLGTLILDNTAQLLKDGESYTRNDQQQPGAKARATQIVVNGVPVTNVAGSNAVSIAGLSEFPPSGSIIKIGGTNYTVASYVGDLANLTITIDEPLIEDIDTGSNVFVQIPNSDPNNIIVPVKFGPNINWMSILDLYPGKFKAGLSQIRLQKPNGSEIVGFLSLDPTDDSTMHIEWDPETAYPSTQIDQNGLRSNPDGSLPDGFVVEENTGFVTAVIDPTTFNPRPQLSNGSLGYPAPNTRYLILEDINTNPAAQDPNWATNPANVDGGLYDGPDAWKSVYGTDFKARANDIIRWDGNTWTVIFTSKDVQDLTYITNSRTGVQYVWDGFNWMKSFEGIYTAGKWRLVL